VVLAAVAVSLQGCDANIPTHAVGAWRGKPNYLNEFKYLPAGKNANSAVLNSCSQKDASPTQQCNGRGFCRPFSTNVIVSQQSSPLAFCQCDRDFADPECGTQRKSQSTAFFLSLFLGFTGADYFYLGYPLLAGFKLFTLGGCGLWWLIDIVRLTSGPVYAYHYRTANDLPHLVALVIVIFIFMVIGFVVAIQGYLSYRRQKRDDIARLQHGEEARHWKHNQEEMSGFDGPRYRTKGASNFAGTPGFSGYGAALPVPHPNANAQYATYGPYAGPFGPAGIPGQGSPTPVSTGVAPTHIANMGRL